MEWTFLSDAFYISEVGEGISRVPTRLNCSFVQYGQCVSLVLMPVFVCGGIGAFTYIALCSIAVGRKRPLVKGSDYEIEKGGECLCLPLMASWARYVILHEQQLVHWYAYPDNGGPRRVETVERKGVGLP